MRCSATRKLISDYIDGNLYSRKRLSLERHLEGCLDCQQLLKDFQGIAEKAKELEKLSPSPQTWLRIKARLETEEQKVQARQPQKREWLNFLFYQPRLKYALSSALVLISIISAAIFGLRYWQGKEVPGRDGLQKYTLAKLDEAERHYQLAIKALMEAASAQEGNLDPQVAEVFQKNFEIIDSSIITCKEAVRLEPDNIETRNYLLASYMEKVDLLNEMMDIKKKSTLRKGLEITL